MWFALSLTRVSISTDEKTESRAFLILLFESAYQPRLASNLVQCLHQKIEKNSVLLARST